ncbi:MAG: hypothetical protein KDA84_26315, partial [Planctomycetaceae bacterium]|nr:hypothetical protein [Planctomycetaceae bacterium]
MPFPIAKPRSNGPLRLFGLAGVCFVLCLELSSSWCVGQVLEPPRANQPANTPPSIRVAQLPPTTSGPIIEGLTGTEGQNAAANTPPPLFSDPLTLDMVQQRLKAATEDQSLDKSQLEQIQALYQKAIDDLKEAAAAQVRVTEWIQKTQSVPAQIEAAKERKQSFGKTPEDKPGENVPLPELQQELAQKEEALKKAKSRKDQAADDQKGIITNRGELSQARKSVQDNIAEKEQQLRNLLTNGNETQQLRAQRSQLRAAWQRLKADLERLAKEEACQQARTELLPLERDLAALQESRL